ncbi:HNH endonuclease [Fictibacillus enclensis]|uniref:HNH endonuclease n=1 Tax=Fictibacillus enclensis TaxID=1017270 RepID=UPI0024BF2901|nr:HNH endonuclease signature motif containing protein [Fictibacillus enclensis]WHY73446.1 HNH endonuclease signature motif containing protein [Fictibacillus enclensis]
MANGDYERGTFYTVRARHKALGVYNDLTFDQFQSVVLADSCTYCGCKRGENERLQADHILPPKLGYANSLKNLAPSCSACNNRKKQLDILTFYETNEAFTKELFNQFLREFAEKHSHTPEDMFDLLRDHQAGERYVAERKAARRLVSKDASED